MKARKITPKDFVPHLMAVLGELVDNSPGVPVVMSETFEPVCARMGISVSEYGDSEHGPEGNKTPWVHRQISLAFRQMRDNGLGEYAKRGHWSLTQEGVDALAEGGDEDEDDDEQGSKIVRLPTKQKHPYSDDPYIRTLAVQQTACFGAFSPRSDVCKECLLTQDCIRAVGVRKAEIAALIEGEELAARKAAEAKAKKKKQQNASIDELISTMDGTDAAAAPGVGKKGKFVPDPGAVVTDAFSVRPSVCSRCAEKIPKGDPCYWVDKMGVYHPQCIEIAPGTLTKTQPKTRR